MFSYSTQFKLRIAISHTQALFLGFLIILLGIFFTSNAQGPPQPPPAFTCPLPANTPPATRDSCFAWFTNGLGFGFDNVAYTAKVQADGKIIVAGDFTSYNFNSRIKVARLLENGTIDDFFEPEGTAFSDGRVNALALQPDGKILCAGTFTLFNGNTRKYIARLNADGTLDNSFSQVGTGLDNVINTILLQADGKILVGGSFNVYGVTNIANICRLNADGSLDATFAPTGTGLNDDVNSIALQADGKIVVGGNFTSYNGVSANKIIRLNTDGSRDAAFVQPGAGLGTLGFVSRVVVQPDGKILVAGGFFSYGTDFVLNIVRINPTGSYDNTLVTGAGFDGTVLGLTVLNNGDIMACGQFTTYNSTSVNTIARITNTGALVSAFNPVEGFNGSPLEIIPTSDGKAFVPGVFSSYRGTTQVGFTKIFAYEAGASIASFTPTQASIGQVVTIVGTNLTGATAVTFGGVPATSFTVNSPTNISATVGAGGATGIVEVVTPIGSASKTGFVFVPLSGSLTVTTFSPLEGPVGDRIRIRGVGFSQVATVFFNNTVAPEFAVSGDTLITALVPAGATSGRLGVAITSGTGVTPLRRSNAFFYPSGERLLIKSFTPGFGKVGDTVRISGRKMNTFTAVRFNGARSPFAVVQGDTLITCTIPTGSTTGKINITNSIGNSVSTLSNFVIAGPAVLSSFSPASGPIGERVRVRGSGLSQVRGVFFGLIASLEWAASGDTLLTAIVPVGAVNAQIGVTNQIGSSVQIAKSVPFFNITGSAPIIRSLTPATAQVGDTVRIIGRRLSNIIQVRFNNNGLRAPFHQVVNDTTVKTVVPLGAATGLVRAINATFSFANSPSVFTFLSSSNTGREGNIEEVVSHETLTVYPNPTRGSSTLRLSNAAPLAAYGVTVLSADGRQVFVCKALGTELASGMALPVFATQGVYLVRLTAGRNQATMRLVVE